MANSSLQSQGTLPPCRVDLHVSRPICSISGQPSFSAIITYTCTSNLPVWFLIILFNNFAHNIRVRDPNHPKGPNRSIEPYPTMMQDEWDQEGLDFEDSGLLLLKQGEVFETAYAFHTQEPPLSTVRSDVKFMRDGGVYCMELGRRKCWRMTADEVS